MDLFFLFCTVGFLESTLERHSSESASMTEWQVGQAFFSIGLVYVVAAPTFGKVNVT